MHYAELKISLGRADRAGRAVRDRRDRGARRADAHLQERAAHHARRCGWPPPPSPSATTSSTRTSGSPTAQAHAQVAAIAAWLARAGVAPGDRVAIAMRNYPEWLLVYWACVAMRRGRGRHERLVDGRGDGLRHRRLRAQGDRSATPSGWSGCSSRPGDDRAARRWSACASPTPPAGVVAWARGGRHARRPARRRHRSRRRRLHLLHLGHHRLSQGRAAHPSRLHHQPDEHGLRRPGDRRWPPRGPPALPIDPAAPPPVPVALITTPLFHVTANNCAAYAVTAAGGKLVLMYRWDAGEALRLIERERVTRP